MKLLIKQVKIIDPSSPYNGKITDLLITNGFIQSIHKNIVVRNIKTIDGRGLYISPGWIDIFADFADPGYEQRESLASGAAAAAAGGFTDVCILPNTLPVTDQKSMVEYITARSKDLPVSIHPLGAVTKKAEGHNLAEMYDQKISGAVAFTDGTNAIQSADILLKALLYLKPFNGVVIQLPDNKDIQPNGLMNEGVLSTQLGLQAKPSIAEELMIARDIRLAEYTASRLHITGISTENGIKLIKSARRHNPGITASVTPQHLFFSEEDLSGYDTNLKLNPPLRTVKDRKALHKAVLDGSIDCIASHHSPHHSDEKVVEFEYAKHGTLSLQTLYAAVNTAVEGISQERIVELLAIQPRKILGMDMPVIAEGAQASLTLFNPSQQWTLKEQDIHSISKNSAYIGRTFTGKPIGIIHNNKTNL